MTNDALQKSQERSGDTRGQQPGQLAVPAEHLAQDGQRCAAMATGHGVAQCLTPVSLRKVTKTRGAFPTDQATLKLCFSRRAVSRSVPAG